MAAPRPPGARARLAPVAASSRPRGRTDTRYAPVASDRDRRMLALGMLGLFVLSAGAIVFVLYQLLAGGGDATAIVASGRTSLAIPAGAQQFGSLAEFERGRAPGLPFVLTITEAELNQRIQTELAKQPSAPYRDVTAKIFDDRIDFSGRVRAAGAELGTTVGVWFGAQNGRLVYEIRSISFGPIPVPGVARQAIADNIDRQIDTQKAAEAFTLEGLEMRPGSVVLVGRSR